MWTAPEVDAGIGVSLGQTCEAHEDSPQLGGHHVFVRTGAEKLESSDKAACARSQRRCPSLANGRAGGHDPIYQERPASGPIYQERLASGPRHRTRDTSGTDRTSLAVSDASPRISDLLFRSHQVYDSSFADSCRASRLREVGSGPSRPSGDFSWPRQAIPVCIWSHQLVSESR